MGETAKPKNGGRILNNIIEIFFIEHGKSSIYGVGTLIP